MDIRDCCRFFDVEVLKDVELVEVEPAFIRDCSTFVLDANPLLLLLAVALFSVSYYVNIENKQSVIVYS